jgi:hypothetical protein
MTDNSNDRGPARYANGRFGPGNPGRRLGSRNRVSTRVSLAILEHFEGRQDEVLEKLARSYVTDYIRLVARLLPRPPRDDAPDLVEVTDEEAIHIAADVRAALDRVEAGEAGLEEVEAALLGIARKAPGPVSYGANSAPAAPPPLDAAPTANNGQSTVVSKYW